EPTQAALRSDPEIAVPGLRDGIRRRAGQAQLFAESLEKVGLDASRTSSQFVLRNRGRRRTEHGPYPGEPQPTAARGQDVAYWGSWAGREEDLQKKRNRSVSSLLSG